MSLPALAFLHYELSISSNAELATLALPKLVKWSRMNVSNNAKLSTCFLTNLKAAAFADISFSNNLDDMTTCQTPQPACVRLTDADGETPWMACSTPQTFSDANARCVTLGGTLASFADATDFARFVSAYEYRLMGELWLGYRDSGDGYAWTDGSDWVPAAGEFWQSAPTNEQCADFGRNGYLASTERDCDVALRFVCSVPVAAP